MALVDGQIPKKSDFGTIVIIAHARDMLHKCVDIKLLTSSFLRLPSGRSSQRLLIYVLPFYLGIKKFNVKPYSYSSGEHDYSFKRNTVGYFLSLPDLPQSRAACVQYP